MTEGQEIGAPGEIRRRSTRAVAVLTGRGATIFVIGFLANLALVRLLSPSDFGIVALGGAIAAFAAIIVDGGFGAGLIRADEPPDPRTLGSVLGVQLLVTGLLASVIGAAAALVQDEVMTIALVMALSLSVTAVRLPAIIVLEREIRYGPTSRVDLVAALFFYAVAIPLAVGGAGAWSLVVATFAREVLTTIALLAIVPVGRTWPRLEFARVRPILRFGLQFQAVGIIQTVRDQLISILTAVLGGLTVTGLATLLTKILSLPSVVVSPLDRVGFSTFSRAVTRSGDHARLIERGITSVILPLGVICVALAASAKPLVAIVFGHQWEGAAAAVPWACIGCYMYAVTKVTCGNYLYAVGSAKVVLWSTAAPCRGNDPHGDLRRSVIRRRRRWPGVARRRHRRRTRSRHRRRAAVGRAGPSTNLSLKPPCRSRVSDRRVDDRSIREWLHRRSGLSGSGGGGLLCRDSPDGSGRGRPSAWRGSTVFDRAIRALMGHRVFEPINWGKTKSSG